MKSVLFAVAAAAAWSGPVQSRPAPFGIPMGTPVNKLRKVSTISSKHFAVRPPTPNPNFVRYEVTATPIHGVCAIRAFTAKVPTQELASFELRSIAKLLSVYGRARNGKISENISWLNLAPKDAANYEEKYWNSALPNNLDLVSAEISSALSGGFEVEVFYGYTNLRRCNNWEAGQNSIGL